MRRNLTDAELLAESERLDACYADAYAQDEANAAAWAAAHPGPCHDECEGCVECAEPGFDPQRDGALDHRGQP